MPIAFHSSSSAVQFVLVTGLLAKIIATCSSRGPVSAGGVRSAPCPACIRGAHSVQHGVHVMMSAIAHEATRLVMLLSHISNTSKVLPLYSCYYVAVKSSVCQKV